MANSKASKKRVFIGERNALRNQAIKSRTRTFVKKVIKAVEAKNVDEANKELDKAVTKGVIKKNTASRKKSRLALKINKLAN